MKHISVLATLLFLVSISCNHISKEIADSFSTMNLELDSLNQIKKSEIEAHFRKINSKLVDKSIEDDLALIYNSIINYNRACDSLVNRLKLAVDNEQVKKTIIIEFKQLNVDIEQKINSIDELDFQITIDSIVQSSVDLIILPHFALVTELMTQKLNATTKVEFLLNDLNKKIELNSYQQTDSIAELWDLIVFKKGGCLGGEQYIDDKRLIREQKPLVFSENEWKQLAKFDRTLLTDFLIGKLADTTKTKVHTCPFFEATTGEMAVYSLQHIHKKNWYDFDEFKEHKNKEYKSALEQHQIWLQSLLKNEKERSKLADLYQNELNR